MIKIDKLSIFYLGYTDAALEPLHPCPMWRRGSDTVDRVSVPCRAASCHMDSPTRADAAQIGPYRPYQPYWPKSVKPPKRSSQAEIQKKKKKVQNASFELNLKP